MNTVPCPMLSSQLPASSRTPRSRAHGRNGAVAAAAATAADAAAHRMHVDAIRALRGDLDKAKATIAGDVTCELEGRFSKEVYKASMHACGCVKLGCARSTPVRDLVSHL